LKGEDGTGMLVSWLHGSKSEAEIRFDCLSRDHASALAKGTIDLGSRFEESFDTQIGRN
jgi:hypothetical protein